MSLSVTSGWMGISKSKTEGRKVTLQFVLSRKGDLIGDPKIISPQGDDVVEGVAKDIIRKSSPFLPFPETKEAENETYEISLYF
ncbi:MAG: hypothetical protein ABIH71_05180 [Candidatus Omnitrophota bacterium]|nr:hypothetical protein [Candidatus Omnitrophota bacterium]